MQVHKSQPEIVAEKLQHQFTYGILQELYEAIPRMNPAVIFFDLPQNGGKDQINSFRKFNKENLETLNRLSTEMIKEHFEMEENGTTVKMSVPSKLTIVGQENKPLPPQRPAPILKEGKTMEMYQQKYAALMMTKCEIKMK